MKKQAIVNHYTHSKTLLKRMVDSEDVSKCVVRGKTIVNSDKGGSTYVS